MQNERLRFIKQSYPCSNVNLYSDIDHAYVTGSIVRGTFYPGWSDIDIVIVFRRSPSIDTLSALNKWQRLLTRHFGCKVGLDYLDIRLIENALTSRSILEANLPSMQNYFKSNRGWLERGLLFGNIDYIPTIVTSDLVNIDVCNGLESLKEMVYEIVLRAPEETISFTHYRILVKFTLYAGQLLLLKDRTMFITDYLLLTDELSKRYSIEMTAPRRVLGQLKPDENNLITFTDADVAQILDCFASIVDIAERSHNRGNIESRSSSE